MYRLQSTWGGHKLVYDGRAFYFSDMRGNGDFASEESLTLLDEADIVVTNPPFSVLGKFFEMLMKHKKKFLIIANHNSITRVKIFPYFMNRKVWVGCHNGQMTFDTDIPDERQSLRNICWWTNLEHDQQPEYLPLHCAYEGHEEDYPVYDNYDAIEVNPYLSIPMDYDGEMGVAVSCFPKLNLDQFEIIGISGKLALGTKVNGESCNGRFYLNGKKLYERIVIKRR